MSYTYPPVPAATTQGGTALEVHQFLKSPTLLARRLRTLTLNKYIADYLLTGRYVASGGAIMYPSGEPLFTNDDPEMIGIGGEYPLTTLGEGTAALTRTAKWGRDIEIFDEAISRMTVSPLDIALNRLANTSIRFVDAMALGVISSKVTATFTASAAWSNGAAMITDILQAKAVNAETNQGYDFDTIVLKPTQYAKVMGTLLTTGFLPRETATGPLSSGEFPNYLGLNWVTSTNVPFNDPFLLDRNELGGMADENIQSPGYVSEGGIEVKTIRQDHNDSYRVRARRVTVPIVLEPNAGVRITGTGL